MKERHFDATKTFYARDRKMLNLELKKKIIKSESSDIFRSVPISVC